MMPEINLNTVVNVCSDCIKHIGEQNHKDLIAHLEGQSFAAIGRQNGTGGQAVKQRIARAARKINAYNNPVKKLERERIKATLEGALNLPNDVRENFGGKNVDDLIRVLKGEETYTSIGKETGITGGSVKSRLDRVERRINGLINLDNHETWLFELKTQIRNVIRAETDIKTIEELKQWVFSEEFDEEKYKGNKILGLGKIGFCHIRKFATSKID